MLDKILGHIDKCPADMGAYTDALAWIKTYGTADDADGLKERIRLATEKYKDDVQTIDRLYEVNRKVLCFCAPERLDDFILYMEIDRPYERKFYLPRRKQLKPVVDQLERLEKREIDLLCISLPPGVGKALANDTPILTRNGWKKHGDLVVGDEVIGLDGAFKRVIAVHPKCMLDQLVTFTNGEKIICHERHEWMVHDRAQRKKEKDYIAETRYISSRKMESGGEKGHRGHRYIFQLPDRPCILGEEKEFPLDPYTLGVWLGDGDTKNPRICCAQKDVSVINRIIKNGHNIRWCTTHKKTKVFYFAFDIRKQLRELGMCNSRKRLPKRIPEQYLTASVRQRLELLAGLIDTDGTLSGSKYEFATSDETLRDTFIELVSTFGWRVCVTKYDAVLSSSGIQARRPHYSVSFTPDIEIPCELKRKRNKEHEKQRRISFESIERTEPAEGNCITVEGDGMYLAGRTMIPTHNTTLAEFFMVWTAGRHPEMPNLTGSHSASFLRGMYGEFLRLLDTDGEYRWSDVFRGLKVVNTNAQDLMIDIADDPRKSKRFMTIEMTSIGAGNAGKVRAGNLLYCDDLVDGLETAMSKERLDKLYQTYATDFRQRKIGKCAELHIATRWSVHDVIGRLEQARGEDPKAKFIALPALDEHDQSNFDYPIEAGFTTEFYHEQREAMDDVSWRCLYMNEPIEREGQLYPEDELRRFFDLPGAVYENGELVSFDTPDAILAVCDTKDKGEDYCFCPIDYQYGDDHYIVAVVCNDGTPGVVEEELIDKHLRYNVQMSQFESNAAGRRVAEHVQDEIKARGGRTKVVTRYTTQNKETKIIVNSQWVKDHCLFLAKPKDKAYRKAMSFLTGYTMKGKNKHDDVPDGMAQLAQFAQSFENSKVTVMRSPFRL